MSRVRTLRAAPAHPDPRRRRRPRRLDLCSLPRLTPPEDIPEAEAPPQADAARVRAAGPSPGLRDSVAPHLGQESRSPSLDDPLIFAGSASRSLGAKIAEYLGLPLGRGETLRFSEGNLFVRVLENVRGRHVYLVQGTVFPANDQFMELLFWIDAC